MFLDASIIVAIIAREADWEMLLKRLEDGGDTFVVSPVARFEAVLGLARKYEASGTAEKKQAIAAARAAIDEFLSAIDATEISITPEIGALAVDAAMVYGKVVGHAADLNFGDCFSYACAKSLDTALGYKGNDFALTDLAWPNAAS